MRNKRWPEELMGNAKRIRTKKSAGFRSRLKPEVMLYDGADDPRLILDELTREAQKLGLYDSR